MSSARTPGLFAQTCHRAGRVSLRGGTLLLLSACTTAWHPVPVDAVRGGQQQTYRRVLLVTRDGYERELTDVLVRSDSLMGTRADSTHQRIAVAVSEIVRLESRESDPGPALAYVGGFVRDVAVGVARLFGEFARCLLLRC